MRDSTKILLLGGIAVLFACLFIGIGLTADNYQYFLSRRVPKVLAIVLAGVAIAQSSLVFQTITHNRILTPSIMGFDALYVLTQILIVLIFGGLSTLVLNLYVNFTIAVIVMVSFSLLLFGFYFSKGSKNLITLLLVGLIFGQLFSNAASFFSLLMDPNTFAIVQSKLYASFNNVKVNLVYFSAPALMFACWLLFSMHRTLDVFWLDQDNAKSLGVDVPKVTRNVFIISAVLIAISTALVGPIMFFGLLVTNLSREMFRSYQHKTLLVGCSFLSISSLLAGQWIIENVFSFETTLSVVINFIGGAYFIPTTEKQSCINMIVIDKLTKAFGSNKVVDEANTQFEKGKVTSIIGPNGAGKSTLLSMASRLTERDGGSVIIDCKEIAEWDTKELAKKLAVLRQANSITMRFTVKELVSFGRFPYSKGNLTKEDHAVIEQAIDYLDLQGIQDKYLDELSGGQRQLAFIAMVIAQDTDYVFLDEPLNNLDIKHSLQIMKVVQRLAHDMNKAMVVVIHDINFAACYSDVILALKQGKVVASGAVEEVIQASTLEDIYETPFNIIELNGKRMCTYH